MLDMKTAEPNPVCYVLLERNTAQSKPICYITETAVTQRRDKHKDRWYKGGEEIIAETTLLRQECVNNTKLPKISC